MLLTPTQLTARLKKDPAGAYLFCGEEAYLRRAFQGELRKKLLTDPDFDTFNHVVHEGAEIDFSALRADVETPPFFAPTKLVEWQGADLSSPKDEVFDRLAELVHSLGENPGVSLLLTVLPEGLDLGTPKRPSAACNKLSALFTLVNFERSTESQLLGWLARHFAHEGVRTDPGVPRLLLSRAGRSMDVLANEVEKLAAYVKAHERDTVTEDDVRFVSVTTTEADAFGLTNALLDRDAVGAFRALADMRARRVDPTIILSQISRLWGDLLSIALLLAEGQDSASIASLLSMNRYRADLYTKSAAKRPVASLREAVRLCADADRRTKTAFGVDTDALIDRLVAELSRL